MPNLCLMRRAAGPTTWLLFVVRQGLLSGSLRALDGAILQHTLGKLNEEERNREQAGGHVGALPCLRHAARNGRHEVNHVDSFPSAGRRFQNAASQLCQTHAPPNTPAKHSQCTKQAVWARHARSSGGLRGAAPPC